MYKDEIFYILNDIIKEVKLKDFFICNLLNDSEKLTVNENKNNSLSYKILQNRILLKFYKMKKISNFVEILDLDTILIDDLQNKFPGLTKSPNDVYIRIPIQNISQIYLLSNEIQRIFKYLFIQYLSSEESFGCCSKYVECSNNLKCVNTDIRMQLGCIYRKNLENNKIFYGKNKNI